MSVPSRHVTSSLPLSMEQQPQQEIHVYGHGAGVVPASDAPPKPQSQPPPRRRLSTRLRILVIAFIAACTLLGVLALLIWLIYRPKTIQVAVDSATLSRFVLNSTAGPPVLSFNLTAGLTITNPNKRVAVYYDLLQAEGYYQDERFGRAALPVSFQGARSADAVRAVLEGSSVMGLGVGALGGDDNGAGVVPVDLWIDGLVRYKFGALVVKASASTVSVKCPLVLQLMVACSRVECTVNL